MAGRGGWKRGSGSSSPAPPGSSAATSWTGCSPTARSSATTTSRPAAGNSSVRRARIGAVHASSRATSARPDRARRRRWRGATSSFTSPRTPTCASAPSHPRRDLEQNTIATFNVLEAMRGNGIRRIAFSSTGSVYGEPSDLPDARGRAVPGADLALRRVEARRRRADHRLLRGLRHAGVDLPLRLDPRRALHARPRLRFLQHNCAPTRQRFDVLGNGKQRKSYLYVQDCVDAMLMRDRARAATKVNIFNLGTDEYRRGQRLGRLHLRGSSASRPSVTYCRRRARLGRRQPVHLARHATRIRALGWQPKLTIREGIVRTLRLARGESVGAGGARVKVCVLAACGISASVTAACLAEAGHRTSSASIDDADIVAELAHGQAAAVRARAR